MSLLDPGTETSLNRIRGDINKYHNGERTRFNGIVNAAFKNGVIDAPVMASEFGMNAVDVRNWSKKGHCPNTRTQNKVIEYIANRIG